MEPRRRITQRDVAIAAQTDQSTVSMALRQHPRVAEETRSRILAIAAELGYRPDPMLASLAGYRTRNRTPGFHGTIGWLADSRSGLLWRNNPHFTAFHREARDYAETLGYTIDVLDLQELDANWPRAGEIARSRGIEGLLVCPQPAPDTRLESFPWEHFSSVTFGQTLTSPRLDAICADHMRNMLQTLEEVRRRGYRRVGCAFHPVHEQRIRHAYTSGLLIHQHLHQPEVRLPICPDDGSDSDGAQLRSYLREHQPDVLITGNSALGELFAAWGIVVPGEIGLASPVVAASNLALTGIWEDTAEISISGVNHLIYLLQHGIRGIPPKAKRILVDGIWTEGQTLRPPTQA